jgi:hypothetical protein
MRFLSDELLAIPRAQEWGKTVKSAFDLYRWKLLSQLGYKQELTTRFAERELWKEISRQTIYGDSFVRKAPLDYVDEKPIATPTPSAAHGGPADLQLEIARGVELTDQTDKLKIVLQIKNNDAKRSVNNIVVTDKLPDGLHYEWDSAASDLGAVVTSGTNPYKFTITGQLGTNQSTKLTYQVISLTSNQTHNVGLRFGRV